jgi:hypothetical protein
MSTLFVYACTFGFKLLYNRQMMVHIGAETCS